MMTTLRCPPRALVLRLLLTLWLAGLPLAPLWAAEPGYESPLSVPGATTISVDQARRLHAQGVVFVDVRNPRLFARRHIPGAIHLDLKDTFTAKALRAVVEPDQPFVLYCSGVKCSRSYRAAEFALEWGFTNIYYFRGGIVAWRDAGLPMTEAEPG